jgi:2,4-dienoyl-CoA reductase-like NADH-dependent reductase (Old Yellow Enzyme family)
MPPAEKDPLFQPFRLKNLVLRNRIMSTSHACGLEEGGLPKDAYQRYHETKVKGGLALTMFGGSSNVAPDSPSIFRQLNVGTDAIIPYLQQFSERIHAQGGALMCQITHLGRRGEPYADNWLPTIAPSPIRETLHRSFPKEMDDHDIARVVTAFGAAARRCRDGGLDGIETLASAHLIGQFLSPVTNRRTDRFGGSLENRCRFGLMVHEEIRRCTGDDFIVGFRFSVDEGEGGGLSFDDSVAIAQLFEASGTIDFFNAVYGRMDTEIVLAEHNMPGMASPMAPWLGPVGSFKREVSLPVFHAARIVDIATARHAIRDGLLDMVAMTRAHIADPNLVAKLRRGEEARIRPCVGATHCMSAARPACLHNAATGREAALPHTILRADRPGRAVVVVGGGPAGLEAARVVAERGHRVVLFEAAAALGGQVRIGAGASWRGDLIGVIEWRAGELARLGVDIHLNRYAEAEDVLREAPDTVIIATGGIPDLDWIDGAQYCTSVWDILNGVVRAGEEIIVYDGTGRHPAPQCAEYLAMAARRVSLVSIDGYLAAELTYAERAIWKKRGYELDIAMRFDHRLTRIARDGNRLTAHFVNEVTGAPFQQSADQVAVERGTLPADALYRELRASSANDGVTDIECLLAGRPQPAAAGFALYRIGDAVASRNIHAAVLDALRLCCTL